MEDKMDIAKRANNAGNLRSEIVQGQILIPIKQWNVDYFFKIIEEGLDDFLNYDRCNKLADKYLIAMVFMYFLRASLLPKEYTRLNFYAALYLAHDMEEDDEDTRDDILTWSTRGHGGIGKPRLLLRQREDIFKRMNCRAVVSRTCCEGLMRIARPDHHIWNRKRDSTHAGANPRFHSVRNVCPSCIGP